MESYEAINHIEKLESALRRLRLDSEKLYAVKSDLGKLKRENKKLKEQLKDAKESGNNNQILQDLLNEQEEIIMSPIRFNGVHVQKIKEVFSKYGVEFEQGF